MSGKPLVLFGQNELTEVAAFYFETDAGRRIDAFTVDATHVTTSAFCGKPVIPFEDIARRLPPETHDVFVAVGYKGVNRLRQEKCEAVRAMGYVLASYVSSRATVFGNVVYGWNSFILENNTLQPFVRIGNGVTLWSGNHVGHHAIIGDFAFISSHVVISGGVKVGSRTFMGVNATTNDHIEIGERCVIGSGALVTQNLADESVVTAEPGKLSPVPSRRLKGF